MSHLRVSQPGEASDSVVSLRLDDDDLARAAAIFARMRDDAAKRHAECSKWLGAGRRIWREPQPAIALRQRTIARIRTRLARKFLVQAFGEWRPTIGRGGH